MSIKLNAFMNFNPTNINQFKSPTLFSNSRGNLPSIYSKHYTKWIRYESEVNQNRRLASSRYIFLGNTQNLFKVLFNSSNRFLRSCLLYQNWNRNSLRIGYIYKLSQALFKSSRIPTKAHLQKTQQMLFSISAKNRYNYIYQWNLVRENI